MPRESLASKKSRALQVCERMALQYPDAKASLDYWGDGFRFAVAVMLSAQTTDAGVNKVTCKLWEKYPSAFDLAQANVVDVEEILRPIGFYKVKSKNCIEMSQIIVSEYGGELPSCEQDLLRLPGVGRKTVNVVMNEVFGISNGIAVDTHVFRIAHKLKFSTQDTPDKVERDLLKIIDPNSWKDVNKRWVYFGREFCIARKPKCADCFLIDICPSLKL